LAIGLFGGAFDPVHFGHLRLAVELGEAFGLERVVFLPTGEPWHRGRGAIAGAEARIAMLELATAGEPRFSIDGRETRRDGPTYTIDTLAEIRLEVGPDKPLVWLCGSDAFQKIDAWHRWGELFDLAHFAVAVRAGDAQWAGKGPGAFPRATWPRFTLNPQELRAAPAGKIATFAMTALPISSSALRGMLAEGANARYLLPDGVLDYILANHTYTGAA
jgi:nicotinate-nucleotide adenylyltransferase